MNRGLQKEETKKTHPKGRYFFIPTAGISKNDCVSNYP